MQRLLFINEQIKTTDVSHCFPLTNKSFSILEQSGSNTFNLSAFRRKDIKSELYHCKDTAKCVRDPSGFKSRTKAYFKFKSSSDTYPSFLPTGKN